MVKGSNYCMITVRIALSLAIVACFVMSCVIADDNMITKILAITLVITI